MCIRDSYHALLERYIVLVMAHDAALQIHGIRTDERHLGIHLADGIFCKMTVEAEILAAEYTAYHQKVHILFVYKLQRHIQILSLIHI